ncbi:MAG: 3-isopropylmalate dehydratase large subunit [Deltaproteobacteria bacterium]|nr:3-isopropylmalate dehydratase large subunit [Deltaproteobacteria bacterium]
MAMTLTEKILAAHADKDHVSPGELIQVKVDLALANDITAPIAIKVFNEMGAGRVFDPARIALIPDHFIPNKDIDSAEQALMMKRFARKHDIVHYYEVGQAGVEHVLLPEKGLVLPGDLVIGADSHTCTYGALGAFSTGVGSTDLAGVMATGEIWLKVPVSFKIVYEGVLPRWVGGKDLILNLIGLIGVEGAIYAALEFTGSAIDTLPMADRFSMSNMAVEAGAKNGIFTPDKITQAYIEGRSSRQARFAASDPGANYDRVIVIPVDDLEPQVAFPHSPANTRPISQVGNVPIDQVFIGSCTNGRVEDLIQAASVIQGHKVARDVRLIILPTTPQVYREVMRMGLLEIFLDAGATIGPPSCGPCLGGHLGILAKGERCVATSNRNFLGRMGHSESEVYLANPAVAAASAVLGRIAGPAELA